jgi:hypothetical protein
MDARSSEMRLGAMVEKALPRRYFRRLFHAGEG